MARNTKTLEYKPDPPDTSVLKPSPGLLCKLGSVVVHAQEERSVTRHHFDSIALDALLKDPEILEWLSGMDKLAMLPKKRF